MERTKSLVKGLASVAQLVFSSITLYRTRGPQIQQYGYAAFGLSVFPYALMSFVNLVVVIIVGEYTTLFVLRTAISDEAKRCGGRISGEIGTLHEKSPVEKGRSIEIGNDGEDKHVSTLSKADDSNDGAPELPVLEKGGDLLGELEANKTTTTLPEAKEKLDDGTGEEKKDGSRAGKPLIPAKIRVEDGVLFITMKGRTGRFKLVENDDACDGNTFHFRVSAVTNQETIPKREAPPVTFTHLNRSYYLFFTILAVLPYVFIFLLTGFGKGNSTPAERGWMMSWLVFSQISTFFGFEFSTVNRNDIAGPGEAACFIITILIFSTPAIGGFVMVGKMLLELGSCSLSY